MNVAWEINYILQVTPKELTLIGRALAGKLTDQEVPEAKELNIKIIKQNQNVHAAHMRNLEKVLEVENVP